MANQLHHKLAAVPQMPDAETLYKCPNGMYSTIGVWGCLSVPSYYLCSNGNYSSTGPSGCPKPVPTPTLYLCPNGMYSTTGVSGCLSVPSYYLCSNGNYSSTGPSGCPKPVPTTPPLYMCPNGLYSSTGVNGCPTPVSPQPVLIPCSNGLLMSECPPPVVVKPSPPVANPANGCQLGQFDPSSLSVAQFENIIVYGFMNQILSGSFSGASDNNSDIDFTCLTNAEVKATYTWCQQNMSNSIPMCGAPTMVAPVHWMLMLI